MDSRSENPCISPFSQCNALLHHRYRLLKPLGRGGFGKTFLALDEQQLANSFCVIKQLLSSGTRQQASGFRQEAQQLADVGEHPQMPRLLHTFEQDGQLFIVQEWIDGWTLEQEVAGMPFDEVEIWKLLRELLPVLQYLHDRQIIHRDIKPANIIRRRYADGTNNKLHRLVLVDSGAAKQVSGLQSLSTGTCTGSAEYAAPEQVRGQAVFASDLYSLGVTCLYLLTQMSPFDLYDMGEAPWKWQAYSMQPISPPLKQILCTLLQPATRQRYQSATEVLAALDALGIQTHLPSTQVTTPLAPIVLAKTAPLCLISQCAFDTFSPAAIAVINATRTVSSIVVVTGYNSQTQRWHDSMPTTETADVAYRSSSGSYLAAPTTSTHGWEPHSPMVCRQATRRPVPTGWRLFTVGLGTAVASVAMTCLLLCISIIFLALAVPPHSSAKPSKADPSEVLR